MNITITPTMPDGNPAPYVMNAEDVCKFLRLGGESDEADRLRTHREKGLKATKYTKEVLYLLPDVIAYAQSRSDDAGGEWVRSLSASTNSRTSRRPVHAD